MGDHRVHISSEKMDRGRFIRHLLNDVQALDQMLNHGLIESEKYRIGAEQELCLISQNWRPQNNAEELLAAIDDRHFTSELARFNLEINLDPLELAGCCFDEMENQLRTLLDKAIHAAELRNTMTLLTGILPTISKSELAIDYLTPQPRYWALNEAVKSIRGSDFHLHIKGVDELSLTHDSVLMEACNTSFQLHLQVSPEDFVTHYNWAQAIAAPVLGIATNSPLLLGRELWSETRIALFQQSIDTRTSSYALKDQLSRVNFGEQWESGSIADIFRNDISQHKVILSKVIDEDALETLKQGRIPKLKALNLHNGTIYRWNRPCYGVEDNKAHVRIENRYIPSGPSIIDEMANFAFWVGLMVGRPKRYDVIGERMDFRDIKSNFIKAARSGRSTILVWENTEISVRDLIENKLLPIAYEGLKKVKIADHTINRLLSIIEKRVSGQNGAKWSISNYRKLRKSMKQDDALLALTKHMHQNQVSDKPIHEWPEIPPQPSTHEHATIVYHVMSSRLFTVFEDDLAEMAVKIMEWKNIHHVPVENKNGKISGLLTWTHIERFKQRKSVPIDLLVEDIMAKEVLLSHPEMNIEEAISIMKHNEIGCLPVVHDDHLIGIVTIKDLLMFDHGEG